VFAYERHLVIVLVVALAVLAAVIIAVLFDLPLPFFAGD
jgi:hypothetical protein